MPQPPAAPAPMSRRRFSSKAEYYQRLHITDPETLQALASLDEDIHLFQQLRDAHQSLLRKLHYQEVKLRDDLKPATTDPLSNITKTQWRTGWNEMWDRWNGYKLPDTGHPDDSDPRRRAIGTKKRRRVERCDGNDSEEAGDPPRKTLKRSGTANSTSKSKSKRTRHPRGYTGPFALFPVPEHLGSNTTPTFLPANRHPFSDSDEELQPTQSPSDSESSSASTISENSLMSAFAPSSRKRHRGPTNTTTTSSTAETDETSNAYDLFSPSFPHSASTSTRHSRASSVDLMMLDTTSWESQWAQFEKTGNQADDRDDEEWEEDLEDEDLEDFDLDPVEEGGVVEFEEEGTGRKEAERMGDLVERLMVGKEGRMNTYSRTKS
ncbi:hypothetical protein HDV05_006989 [Chytridiales sp. JEL 0842]|nr:hypothetical protein HDV05_006989 [Chytridiales sp. JEL 0842]